MKESQIIYGVRPVIEAIRSNKEIEKIFILSSMQGNIIPELRNALKEAKIPIQYVPMEKLNYITKGNHQGIIARISQIEYYDFEEVLEDIIKNKRTPFLIMLDRVTDIRNLGAIARSAECAGVDAIIIPQHGSAQINQDAIKSSAGALLRLPICRVNNLKTAINIAKQYDIRVYSASEKAKSLYTQEDMRIGIMIVLGSEDKGIMPDIIKVCDRQIRIPIKADIESLNVSVAAGILMYEVVRQRS